MYLNSSANKNDHHAMGRKGEMRSATPRRFAIADELSLPFDRISLEMVYQVYHFSVANDKGKPIDPVK